MTQGETWLREARATGQGLTPFVGTGVSIAATASAPCAGWKGLLLSGIDACEQAVPALRGGAADLKRQELNDAGADIVDFLNIGDYISERLKNVPGGKAFPSWIRGSAGKLKPVGTGARLIQAIRDLAGDGVIATTNYDSLLEAVPPRWTPFDWNQEGFAGAARRSRVVLHLHGSAANPGSVILGRTDYQRRKSPLSEVLSRALFVQHTLVFIGCGTGLNDPHIEPVLRFLAEALHEDEGTHYILVTTAEASELSDHPVSRKITSVIYGDEYPELLPFLQRVTASGEATPAGRSPAGSPRGTAQNETGTLAIAITAQQMLGSALDGLQQVHAELCEVESHLAISDAIGKWDLAKRAAEHEKVVGSLAEPSGRLDTECQKVLPRVKEAVDCTWPLALPSNASQAAQLEPIYTAAAQLASRSADLSARAGQASEILRDRTEQVSGSYEESSARIAHAHEVLQKAQRMAGSLHEGLSRPQAGGQPATPPVTPAPDPGPAAATAQPASQQGRHLAPVVGRVSASGISTGIGLPTEERVPVPPGYAQRHGIYAVQVDGDSMAAAGVLDGDYLTVLPASAGEDGEMVVAVFGGESDSEGVVKWLRRPEGSPPYLESPDPADTENLRQAGEFRIQGKVIGVVRWRIRRAGWAP